jgi:hypothetical protein
MRFGRCGDNNGICGSEQIGQTKGRHPAELTPDERGPLRVEIGKPDKRGALACGDLEGMEAAKMAGANDADAEDAGHARKGSGGQGGKEELFFFEKKNQKTFDCLYAWRVGRIGSL